MAKKAFVAVGAEVLDPPKRRNATYNTYPIWLRTEANKLWPSNEAVLYEHMPALELVPTHTPAETGGARVIPAIESLILLDRNLVYGPDGTVTHISGRLARYLATTWLVAKRHHARLPPPDCSPTVYRGRPGVLLTPPAQTYSEIIKTCCKKATVNECKAGIHGGKSSVLHPDAVFVIDKPAIKCQMCSSCYRAYFFKSTTNPMWLNIKVQLFP